ncbi:hypothetical protein E2C01_065199 [Portunus trituberculatus]|uniref:Uncharacterized protein n=1 Tax=Portunus trituberculatus TaxID=210409 RepID=A0A5B7HR31_PORTR|nr:hypothetical protein [Portunus trituberculatus]
MEIDPQKTPTLFSLFFTLQFVLIFVVFVMIPLEEFPNICQGESVMLILITGYRLSMVMTCSEEGIEVFGFIKNEDLNASSLFFIQPIKSLTVNL